MLSAIGSDAARCGYKPSQIEHCLRKLPAAGVHQETDGAIEYGPQHNGIVHSLWEEPGELPGRRRHKQLL